LALTVTGCQALRSATGGFLNPGDSHPSDPALNNYRAA
jgi:hypothetical protein